MLLGKKTKKMKQKDKFKRVFAEKISTCLCREKKKNQRQKNNNINNRKWQYQQQYPDTSTTEDEEGLEHSKKATFFIARQ